MKTKQIVTEQLELRKEELIKKQKEYSLDSDDREIKKKENEINELIERKNIKKSMFDTYQKDIEKIDITIKNIEEIIVDDVIEEVEEPKGEEGEEDEHI